MSLLAQQLQRIAGERPPISSKAKASILFNGKHAADVDRESIFILATTAFETLTKKNPQLQNFASLFADNIKENDRIFLNKEENAALDKSLHKFLMVISPHLLKTQALHLLEWMIRRYQINEYNIDSVMTCILPYHATKTFVKFVCILAIPSDSKWAFLKSSIQKLKVELPREVLVQQSISDISVLQFIINAAGIVNKNLITFYTCIMVQYLATISVIGDDQMRIILPAVLSGLSDNDIDSLASSQMILSLISKRITFEPAVFSEILDSCRSFNNSTLDRTLFTVVTICHSQPRISRFPADFVATFVSNSSFTGSLKEIVAKYETENFLVPFLAELFEMSVTSETSHNLDSFMDILISANLPDRILKIILENAVITCNESENIPEFVKDAFKQIQTRYFESFNTIIKETIGNGKSQKKVSKMFKVLFTGTVSEPFASGSSTLFLSLEHHDSNVRLSALKRVLEIMETKDILRNEPILMISINDSIIRRMADDCPAIVAFILENRPLFSTVNAEKLSVALTQVLSSNEDGNIKSKALSLLCEVLEGSPHLESQLISDVLLSSVLLTSSRKDVIKNAATFVPIVLKKAGIIAEIKSISILESDTTKAVELCTKINLEIIGAISNNCIAHREGPKRFISGLSSECPKMILLSLLVLNRVAMHHKDIALIQALLEHQLPAMKNIDLLLELDASGVDLLEAKIVRKLAKSNSLKSFENHFLQFSLINMINALVSLRPAIVEWTKYSQKSYVDTIQLIFEFLCTIPQSLYRNAVFSMLIQNHSRSQVLEFCCGIWTISKQYSAQILALSIASKIVLSSSKSGLDFQILIPSLIVALRSHHQKVRQLAMECLSAILEGHINIEQAKIYGTESFYNEKSHLLKHLKNQASREFLFALTIRSKEIVADLDYLPANIIGIISNTTQQVRTDFLEFLLSHVLALSNIQSQSYILDIISEVDSALKLKMIIPLLEEVTNCVKVKSDSEVALIQSLVKCFSPSASEIMFSKRVGIDLFVKMISDYETVASRSAITQVSKEFFSAIGTTYQQRILSSLIDAAANAPSKISELAKRQIESINLSAEMLNPKLLQLIESLQNTETAAKRVRIDGKIEQITFDTIIATLEIMKSHSTIVNRLASASHLLQLLQAILNMDKVEEASIADYAKLLILKCVLHFIDLSSSEEFDSVSEESLRLDLIVQSIRVTNDPQTHNAALLLLSAIGLRYPKLVLINIMPIFTFMGANILRHDDDYSYHVINQTIESIIPSLLSQTTDQLINISAILHIFVDSIPHVPVYRRVALFTSLLRVLGTSEYLGLLTGLIVTSTARVSRATSGTSVQFNDLALEIFHTFDTNVQLIGLNSISSLTISILENDGRFLAALGEVEPRSKMSRKMRLQLLTFLGYGLKSKHLGNDQLLPELHVNLIEGLLKEINLVSLDGISELSDYCKLTKKILYDNLQSANMILSPEMFGNVICDLMISNRAITILQQRIQKLNAEESKMIDVNLILDTLLRVLGNENIENKILSLKCLSSFATKLGSSSPESFFAIFEVMIGELGLMHADQDIAATSIVSIKVFVQVLGPRVIPCIAKFMPRILDYCENGSAISASLNIVLNGVSALATFVDQIPKFISSYLPRMIILLIKPSNDFNGSVEHRSNILDLLNSIGMKIDHHVLFPIIKKISLVAISQGQESLIAILSLFNVLINNTPSSEMLQTRNEWMSLFLDILEYRTKMFSVKAEDCDLIEAQIIETFKLYTMKMNEKVFKPVFSKFLEWGLAKNAIIDKQIFLFRLVNALLDTLKSIFVPYVASVMDAVIRGMVSPSSNMVWELSMSIFKKTCQYDNSEFITQERFEKMMTPLISQLEPEMHGNSYTGRIDDFIIPSIGALVTARHVDPALKLINHEILIKTRHSEVKVRCASLSALIEMYRMVGEEMLTYFPETIPFLAELLEDEDENVVKKCQELCLKIQDYLGEPIQPYFNSN